MSGNEDRALLALSKLRRLQVTDQKLRKEFLAIKAEVLFEQSVAAEKFHGWTGLRLWAAQYASLVSTWPNFHRLAIGCCIMFFQQ
jgi:hypothetical protein